MIRHFRRFVALPIVERRLLLQAVIVVAAMRIALFVLPLRWICTLVREWQARSARFAPLPPSRMAWGVQVAARRVPGASCLTQALSLYWLLLRAGERAALRVGVARNARRGFEAHAWVELEGKIVLGREDNMDRFASILAFSG